MTEQNDIVWVCECGCASYYILHDKRAECVNCGNIVYEGDNSVLARIPDRTDDKPIEDIQPDAYTINVIGNATFTRKMVMKVINDWSADASLAMVAAYSTNGMGKAWYDIQTEAQREWMIRKFEEILRSIRTKRIDNEDHS